MEVVAHFEQINLHIFPLRSRGDNQKLAKSFNSSGSRARTDFQSVSGYSSKLEVSPSYDTAGMIGGWK